MAGEIPAWEAARLIMRMLAVSFHFPPSGGESRSVQVHRLLRHLGMPITLVRGWHPHARRDSSLEAWPPIPGLSQILVELPAGRLPEAISSRLRRSQFPWWGKSPDRWRPWVEPAYEAAVNAYEQASPKPDVLVTFGAPWSCHLVGLKLKKRLGLPWVAHFSDLWSDWKYISLDPMSRANIHRIERKVVQRADRVIFITGGMRRVCMRKYPPAWANKAKVLSHIFDPADYPPPPPTEDDMRCLRFLGDFYAGDRMRPVEPLLAGLGLLHRDSPGLLEGVCLEIYSPRQEELALNPYLTALPPGLVRLKGLVPYADSLGLMRGADALLTLEFSAPESVWLPAKLVDYLGSGRPLLGVAPPGVSADFIADAGGLTASPEDPATVAHMLRLYLEALPAATPWGNQDFRREFLPSSVAPRFIKILEKLL